MLNGLIQMSLRYRAAVLVAVLALALLGVWSLANLEIDAFPDTTPVQVQVNTSVPALGPEEVESQVTARIEQELSGLPKLTQLRSISKFGLSQVVATFDDGTDIHFARQLVNQRLAAVQLPAGIGRPQLGPVSTGLGEVFHYLVRSQADLSRLPEPARIAELTDARTLQDWALKPQMRSVRGTAEVNSWGGYEKQYQVRIDPSRLIEHSVTFDQVVAALRASNRNVGGGNLPQNSEMLLVHGKSRPETIDQIKTIKIPTQGGRSIRVDQVAEVAVGHDIRRGAVTADGRGEAVLGLGFLLMGENSHDVTHRMKERLEELQSHLPPGFEVETVYDRTELVDQVIDTVRQNLFEGGLLVIAVLFVFLGRLRAGLIVALAIPLSMLCAFSGMLRFGIAASLLSLGAIDFGLIVDSSVVMVENCVRHLARGVPPGGSRLDVVRQAAVEVRGPTMFGELIIMIVYLPILTLEGVEGKLFRPMALTVIFALFGSMVLSLTLMPVLSSFALTGAGEVHGEPLLMRGLKRLYAPVLRWTMRYKAAVMAIAIGIVGVAFGFILPRLGSEFVPKLSEGAIVINVVRLAGTDLAESIRYNTQIEKAILDGFPDEIRHVWSRIGTAEIATDPMGTELADIFITLRPRTQWTKARTQDELAAAIRQSLRELPGQRLSFTQPIEMRINEMISGIRSDVAVKLFGDDFGVLEDKAKQVERALRSVPGSDDVNVEQLTGQSVLEIKIKPDELARYDLTADRVLELVEALGGKPVGEILDGQLRFPLIARLSEDLRADATAIRRLEIATPSGQRVPLSRVAEIEIVKGQSTITREWGQRRVTISCNVRDRDLGGFVAEAQRRVADEVKLPPGRYHIAWGGQFENLLRARQRLLLVVPLALALIFGLLYLTYRNGIDALRVFTGVPFAWVGGIFALWVRDMPFSLPAAVGFIALSGVAVLDDMLLVSTIRALRGRGLPLDDAVQQAALTRLRPVLMTTLVASLGFVPMAFNTGVGAEVQRPLATVVIGGVISAMVMSLFVLRVLYVVSSKLRRAD